MSAVLALAPLATPPARFLPWTRPSLDPRGLAVVLNDIALHDRRRIVELGGGISTLYVARLLAQRAESSAEGGTAGPRPLLITVEHDPAWTAQLARALAAEGLERWVRLVTAPLVPCPLAPEGAAWYDLGELRPAIEEAAPDGVDLLLVDGPRSGGTGPEAVSRYPALPFFRPYLADGFTLLLDDARRQGERRVLARWASEEGGLELANSGNLAMVTVGSPVKVQL